MEKGGEREGFWISQTFLFMMCLKLVFFKVRVPRVNSQGKVKTFKCKQCEFVAVTKIEFWKHGRGKETRKIRAILILIAILSF